jgi:hypothetical protein
MEATGWERATILGFPERGCAGDAARRPPCGAYPEAASVLGSCPNGGWVHFPMPLAEGPTTMEPEKRPATQES